MKSDNSVRAIRSIEARADNGAHPPFPPIVNRLSAAIVVAATVAGVGLRVVRLDLSPPGLTQDEACNGYDAYSILTTGRDHRGNFLPLSIQAFDDYRMPLFDYSLLPFVAAFGLKPAGVRLCAAMWGALDLVALATVAGQLLGWPGAAAAAMLAAFSPWHLQFSRVAHESITGPATIDLAMAAFFIWLNRRRGRWLLLSGLLFGLSLYSYSITKAFVPMMFGLIALFYWRDLTRSARTALAAVALVALIVLPQGVQLVRHPDQMQGRFTEISVLSSDDPMRDRVDLFGSSFASYFTPAFLFLSGDPHTLFHLPGFGMLLPEQAPLIALGLMALLDARRRRLALFLAGWVVAATLPAALLLSSPHSQHCILAITPWVLLSALGFAVLLDFGLRYQSLKLAAAGVILAATAVNGARFARAYFRDYPSVACRDFKYGLEQVVREIEKYGDDRQRVFMTDVNMGYIFALFFRPYPPALFQRTPVTREEGLFGRVFGFDKYLFALVNPYSVYDSIEHGVFVFAGYDGSPVPPTATIFYPDRTVAFYIVVK